MSVLEEGGNKPVYTDVFRINPFYKNCKAQNAEN